MDNANIGISSRLGALLTLLIVAVLALIWPFNVAGAGDFTRLHLGSSLVTATAIVSWIPVEIGQYEFVAQADNAPGIDEQFFKIQVNEAPVCPVNMISYWKFDEPAGPTFEDSIGVNDASCADSKCPAPTVGIVNSAFYYDGSAEVKAPDTDDDLDWTGTDNFSLGLWVKIAETETCSDNKVFIGRRAFENVAWWVGCHDGENTAAFYLRDSTHSVELVIGTSPLNDDQWHYVVAVRDGENNQLRLYVDAELEATKNKSYTGHFASTQVLTIGYFNVVPYYHLTGVLDEAAIYARVLSLAEIKHNYNNGWQGTGYCQAAALTVNTIGAGAVVADPDEPYAIGQVITLTAVADPGWNFNGWSGDLSGANSPVTLTMESHKTMTATFVAETYSLATNTVGNGVVVGDPDKSEYFYNDMVILTATADPDWKFVVWTGDLVGGNNPASLTITGNAVVTATFAQDVNSLTTNIVGKGAVTREPDQAAYTDGQIVTLTAVAQAGWSFDGWSGDLSGMTNPATLTMDSDKTVTATFVAETYSVEVNVVGEGSVAVEPTGPYTFGQEVTLTAVAGTGWGFAGWSGDFTGAESPAKLTVTSNYVVTATFLKQEFRLLLPLIRND
jgi:hypothetical protein